jgi:putative sporulation protein YyaC
MNTNKLISKPVILCVGTNSVIGDSLGPKVGDLLIKRYNIDAFVYGKTSLPVNGLNYSQYLIHIKNHHPDSIIIAVDACLGTKCEIGKIKYTFNGLRAGAALNKKLDRIGHLTILGIVAEKSNNNLDSLIKANALVIDSLSDKIAKKIFSLASTLKLNYVTSK